MADYIHGYMAKPQIPKTLGILNILFGAILLLFGLCGVLAMTTLPAIQAFGKQAQAKVEAELSRQDRELADKEKAAKDPAELAKIQSDRAKLKAQPRPQLDRMNLDQLNDPKMKTYTYFTMIASLMIFLAMIATGIGLVKLKEWGRVGAIRLAAIGLLYTWLSTGVSIAFIQPDQEKANQERIEKLEADIKEGKAAQNAEVELQVMRLTNDLLPFFAIGGALVSSVYPVLSLFLLNTLGAKEACSPRVITEFSPDEMV